MATSSDILEKLSSSLNRRDEVPNQQLAEEIAKKKDKTAVKELVANLNNKNKAIQSDCVKTLYETGYIDSKLIAPYVKDFVTLLDSKNNRLQWGAMIALDVVTEEDPEAVYSALGKIIAVAEKGSVITKDHYVNILIKLSRAKKFYHKTFPLLIEQLHSSLTNQLPKYAEDSLELLNENNKEVFLKTLNGRLRDMTVETKRKRLEKVISKINKPVKAIK
jgi:hypothetical protein